MTLIDGPIPMHTQAVLNGPNGYYRQNRAQEVRRKNGGGIEDRRGIGWVEWGVDLIKTHCIHA